LLSEAVINATMELQDIQLEPTNRVTKHFFEDDKQLIFYLLLHPLLVILINHGLTIGYFN